MKKSLVIISFAFIFLLSMSIVSAGFWDWWNGDVTKRQQAGGGMFSKRINDDGNSNTLATSRDSTRTSFASRFRATNDLERGWKPVDKLGGGTCYVQKTSGLQPSLFRK